MERSGIITLTTDFGLRDAYVGAMRGAILCRNPAARLCDITHEIDAQDIRSAAGILASACPHFPPGTVHLCVVDPGVGTARHGIVAQAGAHLFVGPDNGVLLLALEALGGWEAHRIERPELFALAVSTTFHGRDVFGPTAGELSRGMRVSEVGRAQTELVPAPRAPEPSVTERAVRGEVVRVDRFGNLITNLPATLLPECPGRITVGQHVAQAFVSTYGDAPPDAGLVALVGSDGELELAVPCGHAARRLGLGVGAPVVVQAAEFER